MGVRSKSASTFALLCALATTAQAAAGIDESETAYRLAAEQVRKHASDFWLDGSPAGEHALNRAWASFADWTAAYLNEHPDATPKRIKRASPGGNLDVLPLGPRTMLVSAEAGEAFGTIFIVDGTHGSFRPVWSIRRRAGREAFPLLSAWTAKAAAETCRKTAGDPDWMRCGSLSGTAKRLSDDAQGRPRFFVEAGYSEAAGNAQAQQLSFWTWTGTTAEPQFVTTADANLDDEPTRLDGALLTVRVAEDYRAIAPWWDHLDRELDWTFRVTPEGIEDLGKNPVVPEMDVVDEVLFRALHRLSADDLATRQVQAAVEKIVQGARKDDETSEPSLPMAGGTVLRHQNGQTLVCLPSDEAGNLTFTLTGSFISDLSVTQDDPENGCPQDKP